MDGKQHELTDANTNKVALELRKTARTNCHKHERDRRRSPKSRFHSALIHRQTHGLSSDLNWSHWYLRDGSKVAGTRPFLRIKMEFTPKTKSREEAQIRKVPRRHTQSSVENSPDSHRESEEQENLPEFRHAFRFTSPYTSSPVKLSGVVAHLGSGVQSKSVRYPDRWC